MGRAIFSDCLIVFSLAARRQPDKWVYLSIYPSSTIFYLYIYPSTFVSNLAKGDKGLSETGIDFVSPRGQKVYIIGQVRMERMYVCNTYKRDMRDMRERKKLLQLVDRGR